MVIAIDDINLLPYAQVTLGGPVLATSPRGFPC